VKLTALASLVHGEIIGNQDIDISGVSGILEAHQGDITFLSSNKYA
jgi:UDP-3-O-[3-hydroxymyristoyl] glucosamine N-acyltransferase